MRWIFEIGALPYELLVYQQPWRDHCRAMLSRLPAGEGRRILDAGCGPGVSALAMRAASPGDLFVGLDLSSLMLSRAASRRRAEGVPPERLPLVQGDATQLPFADESFDGVTGHSFAYLIPRRELALQEIRRVLRPGGRIVLLEPAAGPSLLPVLRSVGQGLRFAASMAAWRVVSGGIGRFTPTRLEALLTLAGFREVSTEPTLSGLGLFATGTR